MCNCQNNNPCSQSTPCTTPNCACPVFVTSDCVNNVTEDLTCSNIMKGQTLTEVLVQLDTYICEKFGSITDFLSIINVGSGANIYKGDTLTGKKQLRSLVDSNLINIAEGTDTVTITVDETALNTFIENNQKTYSAANAGVGVSIYKDTTVSGDSNQFNLRKLKSSNSTVNISEDTDEIDLTITPAAAADGSETKVTPGTNVTVTGSGTIASPYVINAATPNGSETKINAGVTTTITGNGTVATPYVVETVNLQRVQVVTTNYTIVNTDNNYSLIIDNGAANVTVTVPASGLDPKFQIGFIQKGTGDITFVASGGVTIQNPTGLKSKGQYYSTFIEKEASTQIYYLLGNTKA